MLMLRLKVQKHRFISKDFCAAPLVPNIVTLSVVTVLSDLPRLKSKEAIVLFLMRGGLY